MNRGHLVFAQNSDVNYVRQAIALAFTIKKFNKHNKVCIVTNDIIPTEFTGIFDHVIKIPMEDCSNNTLWKIENRWKLIHASPFDETLVYDSDMILLDSNDNWWNFLEKQELHFTNNIRDYRGNIIINDSVRKCFTLNELPNIYFGLHFFKKSKKAFEFYKWLEIITKNYTEFYDRYSPKNKQNFCSMDVSSAIAIKIIGDDSFYSKFSPLSFIHMKKELQNWKKMPLEWIKSLLINYTDDGKLYLSNNLQYGVFHYTEDNFLSESIFEKIKKL